MKQLVIPYVGLDVHQATLAVSVRDEQGRGSDADARLPAAHRGGGALRGGPSRPGKEIKNALFADRMWKKRSNNHSSAEQVIVSVA